MSAETKTPPPHAVELRKPAGHDAVERLIDSFDWSIGGMGFHVIMCLDVMCEGLAHDPQSRADILTSIFARYDEIAKQRYVN